MILPLDGKWKMIFLKKTGKYDIFLECSDIISKEDRAGTSSFLYYLESWYFFPENTIIYPDGNKRDDLSQEIHGNMIFSIWYFPRPPAKKIKDDFTTQKCT